MKRTLIAAAALALGAAAPANGQSPLAAYPGFGHNAAADEARFEREEQQREQMIAECMRAAGFRYTPAPPVRGASDNSAEQARAASVDPNLRHAESLSPERRRDYFMALYGVPDPYSQEASDLHDPESATGGGCTAEALRSLPGVYAAAAALTEEYIAMRRSVLEDPRVTAAEGRWATCMREKGHDFSSSRQMRREVALAARADRAQGRALLERVNPAARECGRTAGLDAAVAEARNEAEAAFVAQHRAVLDRHAARAGAPSSQ